MAPCLKHDIRKMQEQRPLKPWRKNLEAQVHGAQESNVHKTFSANHPRKTKTRNEEEKEFQMTGSSPRISRKHLVKENERISLENEELRRKLSGVEEYLNQKKTKFKEKLCAIKSLNENIASENSILRSQYREVVEQFTACQKALETCSKCAELREHNSQIQSECITLKKCNCELSEDVTMLKTVVYRLNVQLEKCQETLHKHNIAYVRKPIQGAIGGLGDVVTSQAANGILPEEHWGHGHTPVSWGKVYQHTLAPLLNAYQETVAEKEEIIRSYEGELANVVEKLKQIVKENEDLYRELTEDEECSKVLGNKVGVLEEELKSVRLQNDLLIKKCAIKQEKLEEVLKCYEQKVTHMSTDYKVLHEEFCKSRTETAALREKNNTLQDVQKEMKSEHQKYIPLTVHNASVNECKKWYEELKQQYESEKGKLQDTISDLHAKISESLEKVKKLTDEKIEVENKLKSAEKQTRKMESKCVVKQRLLDEVQASKSACKKQLSKAMVFAKDLVDEQESLLRTLNERQRENRAVKKIGTEIAKRMDFLKLQLKTVQKEAFEELTTVEHRLEEQNSIIQTMKQEHMHEIDRLTQLVKDKEGKNVLFTEGASIPLPHYVLFRDKNLHT